MASTYVDRAHKVLASGSTRKRGNAENAETPETLSKPAPDREISEISEKSPLALTQGHNEVRKNERNEITPTPTGAAPYADPRPDLVTDTALWATLLPRAYAIDGRDPEGIYGSLLGMRCWGAALTTEGGRVRLIRGEIDAAEYDEFRARYLWRHRDAITSLLADLPTEQAA